MVVTLVLFMLNVSCMQMILLSYHHPSLIGFQLMLDACTAYGRTMILFLTARKSVCFVVCKMHNRDVPNLCDSALHWVKSCKYL